MPLAGFNNSFKLTIDSSKVDEDLTDFPVNITLSSGTGQTGSDVSDVFTELTTVESGTVLLLHMNGDASDGHSANCAGTPKIHPSTTFSGFNSLGYMEFNGTTDYLTIFDHADWDFGSDNFTVECWVYFNNVSTYQGIYGRTVNTNNKVFLRILSNGTVEWYNYDGGVFNGRVTSDPINDSTWYHVAVVRNGTTLSLYLNGMLEDSDTITGSIPDVSKDLSIGRYDSNGVPNWYYLDGYIAEFRISKGTARWISNFTVPTEPYESDSYTKLLMHFDGDQSNNDHIITFYGDVSIYTSSKVWGGSYYFDGVGDYLSIPDSSDWYYGSEDFTIEFWVYRATTGTDHYIYSQYEAAYDGMYIYISSGNELGWQAGNGGGSWAIDLSAAISASTWHHVAFVRNNDNWNMYIDGVSVDSTTNSIVLTNKSSDVAIGVAAWNFSSNPYEGYMSELNILKGVAKYTSNFAVPQGPPGSSWDNRKKIAITDSSYNQLYTEIERWNYINEEANLWVNVPTIVSGTDTTLYLYYDVTATTNSGYVGDTGDSPAQQVWNDNFKGVWHMSQDPSGGSGAILDSTSNVNHGTPGTGLTSDNSVDGVIGKAINFDATNPDATNDYIDVGSNNFNSFPAITLECMYKPTTLPSNGLSATPFHNSHRFIDKFWDNTDRSFTYGCSPPTDKITFHISTDTLNNNDGVISANSAISVGNTYYVAASWDGNSNDVFLYVDGIKQIETYSRSGSTTRANTSPVYIGAQYYNNMKYGPTDGIIDEARISNISRSYAWIKASYYSNWDDLITFSQVSLVVTFVFSNPIPISLSTVYGITRPLQLTTVVTGTNGFDSYNYDAVFYDASDDSQIGQTISGTQSGQYVSTTMSTPSATDYSWYIIATSSGQSDTSSTYTYSNRFMCSGHTQVAGTGASGIPVRLYRRSTGAYIGGAISSGVSGTFDIITDYNEYHYAVALYPTDDTNALIEDWLKPDN